MTFTATMRRYPLLITARSSTCAEPRSCVSSAPAYGPRGHKSCLNLTGAHLPSARWTHVILIPTATTAGHRECCRESGPSLTKRVLPQELANDAVQPTVRSASLRSAASPAADREAVRPRGETW